jgi:hypothetical protein
MGGSVSRGSAAPVASVYNLDSPGPSGWYLTTTSVTMSTLPATKRVKKLKSGPELYAELLQRNYAALAKRIDHLPICAREITQIEVGDLEAIYQRHFNCQLQNCKYSWVVKFNLKGVAGPRYGIYMSNEEMSFCNGEGVKANYSFDDEKFEMAMEKVMECGGMKEVGYLAIAMFLCTPRAFETGEVEERFMTSRSETKHMVDLVNAGVRLVEAERLAHRKHLTFPMLVLLRLMSAEELARILVTFEMSCEHPFLYFNVEE